MESFQDRVTHDVDQHRRLLESTEKARHWYEHKADRDDNHERRGRVEVIVHENAEVLEDRRDCRADGQQQEGGELWRNFPR